MRADGVRLIHIALVHAGGANSSLIFCDIAVKAKADSMQKASFSLTFLFQAYAANSFKKV